MTLLFSFILSPALNETVILTPEPTVTHPSHPHTPGQVMVMGQGDVGQLGLGEEVMERKRPFPVSGELKDENLIQVVCGGMHSVALTEDGKVSPSPCLSPFFFSPSPHPSSFPSRFLSLPSHTLLFAFPVIFTWGISCSLYLFSSSSSSSSGLYLGLQ